MHSEKLATEYRSASQQMRKIVAIAVVLLLLAGLIIWNMELMFRESAPSVLSGDTVPPTTDISSPPTSELSPPSEISSPPQAVESDMGRDDFKANLRTFDEQFLPAIQNPGFRAWNATEHAALVDLRQAAVNQFSQGDYAKASTALAAATDRAEASIANWNATFDGYMTQAKAALSNDSYDAALSAIENAKAIHPDDPSVSDLAARIAALPELLQALERVRVAHAEGNLEAELDGLEEATRLDPQRTDLAQRKAEIETALREQRFAGAIAAGFQNVDQENLNAARQTLAVAHSIFPARDETLLLQAKIDQLQRTLDVRTFLADANRHAEADNWQSAANEYGQVLQLEPDNRAAQQGKELSTEINGLQEQLDAALAAPHRLSSSNVAQQAKALSDRARVLSALSPRLRESTATLDHLLEAYNQPVDVDVVSDGETFILVRRVGKVGQTLGRTIRLKPGKYTFEGSRQGYVSKLIDVEIPANGQTVSVTVVCDERI